LTNRINFVVEIPDDLDDEDKTMLREEIRNAIKMLVGKARAFSEMKGWRQK